MKSKRLIGHWNEPAALTVRDGTGRELNVSLLPPFSITWWLHPIDWEFVFCASKSSAVERGHPRRLPRQFLNLPCQLRCFTLQRRQVRLQTLKVPAHGFIEVLRRLLREPVQFIVRTRMEFIARLQHAHDLQFDALPQPSQLRDLIFLPEVERRPDREVALRPSFLTLYGQSEVQLRAPFHASSPLSFA